MSDRIKLRLNKLTSKESVNVDASMKINLDSTHRLLPVGEVNKIVDAGERFDYERQNSSLYRILGTLRPLVSNPLFNISGTDSWTSFDDNRFKVNYKNELATGDETITYDVSTKTYLKEVDGWFGYTDPDITVAGFCNYYDMEPKRRRFTFTPDILNNDKKNWELTVTYPYSSDTKHFIVDNGLFICDKQTAVVGSRTMTAFGTPVYHNLTAGDTVRMSGTSMDGDYTVIKLGLDDGTMKGYYFVLDVSPSLMNIGNNSRLTKILAGQPSEYYFRLFKKIKTTNSNPIEVDDYEVYNVAFSNNIFNDPITQFVFNEDIDISDLVDNLGRPLSELYLTMVKTDSSQTGGQTITPFSFSNVDSGIETPFISELNNSTVLTYLQGIPVIGKIHNGGSLPFPSHTPLETNITIANDTYYGDVVEYNKYQVKEIVLAEVYHRFNTTNRETGPYLPSTTIALGPRQEGYQYKAHHLIKIREFSSYVEQGDASTDEIPVYAQDLGDGRYLWRDLLSIGFNDAKEDLLDYPFLNGCHYIHQNYCFGVKRQDAFGEWGLYYSKFPADPFGDLLTDNFVINSNDNDC